MVIPRSPEDLRELAAMTARTYAMNAEDRDRWYRRHPLSEYEAAARDSGWTPDAGDDASRPPHTPAGRSAGGPTRHPGAGPG